MNKIIIIGGGLVVALSVGMFLVWPQYQKIQVMNADIKTKEENLQSQLTYFAQVRDISENLKQYSDAISKISSALPRDSALSSLVNFLQTNSSQTGLIFKKIALGGTVPPSEGKKSWAETQVIIQVSGSYQSFKDFLRIIENSARIIDVQNISVEIPSKESKESPTFTLDLKTSSY